MTIARLDGERVSLRSAAGRNPHWQKSSALPPIAGHEAQAAPVREGSRLHHDEQQTMPALPVPRGLQPTPSPEPMPSTVPGDCDGRLPSAGLGLGRRMLSTPLLASQASVVAQCPTAVGRADRRGAGLHAPDTTKRPSLMQGLERAGNPHQLPSPNPSRPPSRILPAEGTRWLDSETEVPDAIFETMLKLGKEVKNRGQHVLVPKSHPAERARLVHLDLAEDPSQKGLVAMKLRRPRTME